MSKKKKWNITAEKFLDKEQVSQLVSFIEDQKDLGLTRKFIQPVKDYYTVMGILQSGLRCFEFCNLKDKDIQNCKLTVQMGKGKRPRTVLLTKSASNLFDEWKRLKKIFNLPSLPDSPFMPNRYGNHFSTRGIRARVKYCFEKADLPEHFSVHSLRHTYCSLLLETKQVSLSTIRDNLGHGSLAVVNVYAHAVGSLENIELLPSTSEILEKSEPKSIEKPVTTKKQVRAYQRKRNQNRKFRV